MAPSLPADGSPVAHRVEWRGAFESAEVDALHAECFGHRPCGNDWWRHVHRHSLGWVCTRRSGELIGFVNVAWDGGSHAFILDTMVRPAFQRQGIASLMIEEAVARARSSACEWLHVDFEQQLGRFYLDACGFKPTAAGILSLK